jgi:hypothetical protein
MENIGGAKIETFTDTVVQVFDNPFAPELYAEGQVSMFSAGGNVSVTLYAPRSDPAGKIYRAVVGRITLPAHGAHAVAVALFDFLNRTGLNPEQPGRAAMQ